MNEEQKSSPHKNAILFQYILLLFCIYLGFLGLMGEPIAKYKAKNPKNILQGCLYYTGVNFKGTLMGRINNEDEDPVGDMHIDSFPQKQSKKRIPIPYSYFHCYKVKYIVVDFNIFTNYSMLKRYYIYDYVDY